MPIPVSIENLIENFERNLDAYRSGQYNETQVRRDFIDPMFKALGWDMDNTLGYAEAYRDVIHEDSLKIDASTRAPDYCFRIGGVRKFFLEAKKPSVKLKDDIVAAFQLRRYGWSAKLPISVLTDFEEFAIYDCRVKPDKGDKASKARLFYCKFNEYPQHWDEIAAIFSKEAILRGSFDKYASDSRGKRGTGEVDSAFLHEIEGWREELARNIALRNKGIDQASLNFSVQQTIDRIIFLRICEDRGIEPYGRLRSLAKGVDVYPRLVQLFKLADDRYNSGLFHFRQEKGRKDVPDLLTPSLQIDDKPLRDIFKSLYYPDCPYEFSVLGSDILGSVYEQFLGKVIRLTSGGRAVVEDKPDVKKAGGVFYTPSYVVEFMVENSLGKALSGKRPKQSGALTVLDPACGSGSFLIGVYQYLLDWHLERYIEDGAEKHAKGKDAKLRQDSHGAWRLTTAERKRILINHIFGVDIDAQAVEVTKLSLLLKVLEGESNQTLSSQMALFHERVLPDLDRNIKCGNSIISPDFHAGNLASGDLEADIIPFDWSKEFPSIFKSGGFDLVIGNPPYGATLTNQEKAYLSNKYPFVSDHETSQHFLAKAATLTKNKGYVTFIVPNTLFLNVYANKFRAFLKDSFRIEKLADLSDVDVFKGATVRTIIPFLTRENNANGMISLSKLDSSFKEFVVKDQQQSDLDANSTWISLGNEEAKALKARLGAKTIPLNEILEVSQGLIPYDKYRGHDEATIKNRIWHSSTRKNKTFKPELRGGDVSRYNVSWNGETWVSYGDWLAAPRKPKFFNEPRLLFREITDPKSGTLHVAYTDEEFYNTPSIINCVSRSTPYSLMYVLAIANSRLTAYLHYGTAPKAKKGVFPKILVADVRNILIPKIDFGSAKDVDTHDRIAAMAQRITTLTMHLRSAKTPAVAEKARRDIAAIDSAIDKMIYNLIDLSTEEISVLEGTTL